MSTPAGHWIEYVRVRDLVEALTNPKSHADGVLDASLDRFDYTEPVLMDDRTGRVIAGHGRKAMLLRAQEAGKPIPRGIWADEDGEWHLPVVHGWASKDDAEADAYLIASNRTVEAGGWVIPDLAPMLSAVSATPLGLVGTGYGDLDLATILSDLATGTDGERAPTPAGPSLADRFVVPPFSVLDARQGYWQDRKRQWLAIGMRSELGRGEVRSGSRPSTGSAATTWGTEAEKAARRASPGGNRMPVTSQAGDTTAKCDSRGRRVGTAALQVAGWDRAIASGPERERGLPDNGVERRSEAPWDVAGAEYVAPGTSIFDPVLCEIAVRWFCPPGGLVLDPFAGGSVRGVVAGRLGRRYVGVELRPEQVAANREQVDLVGEGSPIPEWRVGDSRDLACLVPETADLVFTCPPYFDLEVYSDDPADLSQAGSYEEFDAAWSGIIAAAADRLADDRFMVLVVSEVRGPSPGRCRGFVPDTITAARHAGLDLYNEAVLINAVSSLSLRAGRQFAASRKLGRGHQNVLVFSKGDPRRAADACGVIEVADGDPWLSLDTDVTGG